MAAAALRKKCRPTAAKLLTFAVQLVTSDLPALAVIDGTLCRLTRAGAKARGHAPLASAVAEFGLLLRDSRYKGRASFESVLQRAEAARGSDREGYRGEFLQLVRKAEALTAAARKQ